MINRFGEYLIEIVSDSSFNAESTDNINAYDIVHNDTSEFHPSTKYGVRVTKGEQKIADAIIYGHGGATGIHENSFTIEQDLLLICCGDDVYALKLPSLTIHWKKKLDWATCFAIYRFQEGFVIHGEIEITKIDIAGNIAWKFSGKDIFVTSDGRESLKLAGDRIEATDWTGTTYLLSDKGTLIATSS